MAAALAAAAGLGFGIPGIFGLRHFAQTGDVWTLAGFPTYGSGPFENIGLETNTPLLAGFVVVCVAEVGLAAALWRGGPKSTTWSHSLLPVELAYWSGFALPFGFLFGIGRTALLLARPNPSSAA
ncbi:hypothetical protein [Nocardioides okcheonensis]|uniref:hypothetical protein n=1 Tax=Nocardioides okcheonensis TaxID=2894081 RepID=UPI001E4AEFCA|nr:hypothetical protein [Nocardioides okcheonensis]UFN45169.1 hypothetical protein LN652_02850 [Nocardioides okcheonensis]